MKRFIICLLITILVCLLLLGSAKTVNSNMQVETCGIYTSTVRLEPKPVAEIRLTPLKVKTLVCEQKATTPLNTYEVFVTEIQYTQEEIEYVLNTSTRQGFYPYAQTFLSIGEKYEINPIFLIAQFGLESGWGTSKIFINKNNIGGWKLNNGTYKTFESVEESIEFITSKLASRYSGFSLEQIASKYCTDIGYAESIKDVMFSLEEDIKKYRGF